MKLINYLILFFAYHISAMGSAQQNALTLIKEGEGCKLTVYNDTKGYPTIGYGHKLKEHEKGKLNQISQAQAEELLKEDMQEAIQKTKSYFGSLLDDMGTVRAAVLIDMMYNMGNLSAWNGMTSALKNQDYDKAAEEIMDSKYAKDVGDRALRNSVIMRTGQMKTKQEAKQYQ